MKKLLLVALALIVFTGVSSAAITSCTSQASWTLAQLVALNGGCEIGDKIFTNWSGSLSNSNDTIQFLGPAGPVSGPNPITYQLNVNAATVLSSSFTFGYTISIDAAQVSSPWVSAISRVTAGIQDNGNDTANLTKTISGGASCTASSNDVNGVITPSPCTGISATSLNVSEVFTYTSNTNPGGVSAISGIGNTFTESFTNTSGTPEPMSMLLFGSGFIAISVIARKRRARS